MPSLWDLLCVSRQKYATDSETKHRPHRKWDDPPYYHAPRTEYYMQPDARLNRLSGPGFAPSSPHYGNPYSPRSPQYGGFFSQDSHNQNAYPQHSPYVFTDPSGPQSPSMGDFIYRDRHDVSLLNNRQTPRAEPIQSEGYLVDNRRDEFEEERNNSGKRRHIRDIFAHVTTRSDDSQDDRYQAASASSSSVTSYASPHNQQLNRTEPRPPGHRQTSQSAQASEMGPGTGGSVQNFLPTQNPDLGQSPRSKQISGFTQPTESGHILTSLGFPPVAGSRPINKVKQAENMAQYSPRTVSDNAISAALFGNRLDDFVHDPGWNRAIDKFAASPTSPSAFSFGDKSFSPSPNKFVSSPQLISPTKFEGNVVFKVAPDSSDVTKHDTRHTDLLETTSKVQEKTTNTSPVYKSGYILMDSELTAHNSQGTRTAAVDITDTHPVSPGSDLDIETFLGENGEVLY